jgi:prolipoprotein diacylglyceryl transferase
MMAMSERKLAYISSPSKSYISFFGFHIYFYSLCIVGALFIGILLLKTITYRCVDSDKKKLIDEHFNLETNLYLVLVLSGILGARIYSVLTDFKYYKDHNLLQFFNLRAGGIGIYGGIAGALIAFVIWCKLHSLSMANCMKMLDFLVPSLAIGQAIGRWGNYFNNELYGTNTDVSWRLKVYLMENGRAATNLLGEKITLGYMHPLFLYESLFDLLLTITLIVMIRNFNLHLGVSFFLYLALYSFFRAFLENLRDSETVHLFGMRINIVVSLLLLYFAIYRLLKIERREHFKGDNAPNIDRNQ